MIITTTSTVSGRPVGAYLGVVSGEVILGANALKDMAAGFRDIVGGRSGAYEATLIQAREAAQEEAVKKAAALGADALIGVDVDYEVLERGGDDGRSNMLMVSVSGTAVRLSGR